MEKEKQKEKEKDKGKGKEKQKEKEKEKEKEKQKEKEKEKEKQKEKEKKKYLLKTEPSEWSWEDQAANGGISKWDGVKNKQAQKYLKSMSLNDLCFFYHSGPKARRIVGVVSVIREWYGDAVDVKAVGEMRRPVDLKEMKHFNDFALLKQPRLSVVPVPDHIWNQICLLGGGYDGDDSPSPLPLSTNVT